MLQCFKASLMAGKCVCPSLECHKIVEICLLELETNAQEIDLTCLEKEEKLFCM